MNNRWISRPIVTVIIPAYNHELYIEQCLSSVVAQTYENIEIIVINDGSKDRTGELIEKFIKKEKKQIKYIDKNNEGLCKTLNMGIGIAKGKYVTFIASDDVWMPNRLEVQVSFMQNNKNIGLVYSDAYFMRYDKITTLKYSDYKPKLKNYFVNGIQNRNMYEGMLVDNIVLALTVMMKKECFDKIGVFDESLKYEDYDMWLRVSKCYPIAYVDMPLAYYRVHDSNVSNDARIMLIGALQTIFKQYKTFELKDKLLKAPMLFVKFIYTVSKNRIYKKIRVKNKKND